MHCSTNFEKYTGLGYVCFTLIYNLLNSAI